VVTGGTVFFQASSYGRISKIMSYDLHSGAFDTVAGDEYTQYSHPAADGSVVIWVDWASKPYRLMAADVSSGERLTIAADVPIGQKQHDIDGEWIVYSSGPSGARDLYAAQIPEPATVSLLAIGTLALLRRRREPTRRMCNRRA
jgi:hypothetical protein